MTDIAKIQIAALLKKTDVFAQAHGEAAVTRLENDCALLIHWLNFLSTRKRTEIANELLDGAASAIRETAACLGLGMIRPALFSLRMQIDLILGWLYFKDHSIEWGVVNDSAKGFMLKSETLEYLAANYKGFSHRMTILKDVMHRTTEDPYRLLSGHVHAQSVFVIPSADVLADVIQTEAVCIQCVDVAREVSEYMSDVLVSVYASTWEALPAAVTQNVMERLGGATKGSKERFFSTI